MVHACEYVYACVIMSVCVYVYTYVYVSAYAYVCVCVCVHVYVCKFMSNALNVSIFVIHSITYPNLIRFCSLCTVQIGTTAVSIIITVSTIWNAAIATYSICSTSAGAVPSNAQPHVYVQAPVCCLLVCSSFILLVC